MMMIITVVIITIIITMESVISNLWADCARVALLGLVRPKVENAFTRSTSQPVGATLYRNLYHLGLKSGKITSEKHLLIATTLCA